MKKFVTVYYSHIHDNLIHIDAYYDEDENSEGVCIGTVHEESKEFTLGKYASPEMVFQPLVLIVLKQLGAKF